jgi:predicted permease
MRNSLVVAEVALATVLLIGSALLIRTMSALSDIRAGFEPAGILSARYSLPGTEYDAVARRAFLEQLLERVRALAGVEQASAAQGTPFSGWNVNTRYEVAGEPPAPLGQEKTTHMQYVMPGFFSTLQVPMVRGRDFVASDNDSTATVAIVNESFVARHFPGGDPLGKRIRLSPDRPWLTIVGVLADYRHYTLTEPMGPATYLPFGSNPRQQMTVVVKTSGPTAAMVPTLRRVMSELDPNVPAYRIEILEDEVARQTWVQRIARDILTAFAATAALLAVIGLYGVISYSVLRQRHELGIRLALGATPRRVRRLVVRQGLTLGLAGILPGWLGALAAVRLLEGLLFEVQPGDVTTFAATPLAVAALALLAAWLPARRAAALDPVTALRND